MTLSPGTRLGPYEIIDALGAGGMGQVFRSRDTTLNREVAIKVLPEAMAGDAERLARFKREAQVLASLNHSNIAHVYGFESAWLPDSSAVHFLAMELLPGEDLSERLKRGAIPLDEAISIAKQIAEGLEEAHGHGIIHRDLKPANVKVTPEGKVKLLDFGLAKAYAGEAATQPGADLSQSPTLARTGTQAGVLLGTAAYMSPEQARGKPVDKRTDIWAFGVVLFEMLAGRPLFAGETITDVLAAVVRQELPWTALPPVPPELRRLLQRCLERDPRDRLHDIADARILMSEVDPARDPADPNRADVAHGKRGAHVAWLAALGVVGVVAGLARYSVRSGGVTASVPMHFAIQLAAEQELGTSTNELLAFAPDGRSLVFSGVQGGRRSLFRRELGERDAKPIPSTEGGTSPFFSPDGRWLGFVSDARLRKIATEGGSPFSLADAQGAGGGAWLPDDSIVYTPFYSSGLRRISAEGGTPEALTTPDRARGELGHWWPDPLPGGRRVLFTACRIPIDRSRIGVLDLGTREVSWLVDEGFFGRYVSSGHLLYVRGQRLYAVAFDPARATVEGRAVAVVEDLSVSQTGAYAQLAVSSRGTLAYVAESLARPPSELVWFDREGRAVPATNQLRRYVSVRLSPDERSAALTIRGESQDLWTLSLARGTLSRLTSSAVTETKPVWSRDGRELFYVADTPAFALFRIGVGAVDAGRPLWDETTQLDTYDIAASPDGRSVAFARTEEQTGRNLYVRPLDGSAPARPIRASRAEEYRVSFSPDGRFVAYQSDETGRPEVYAQALAEPGERIQVSAEGGTDPLWAGNGEIFYRRDAEFRVATPRRAGSLDFAPSRTLFSAGVDSGRAGADQGSQFDVTRDGTRILAILTPPEVRPRQIEVITDWTSELERRAPRGPQ